MDDVLACFRCGASLAQLSLPLSRRDLCPACGISLHVCRMCLYFDATVPKQCREDDAEEVVDKEKVNFCEWFKPAPGAFDPARAGEAERAKAALSALFGGEAPAQPEADSLLSKAEDLFK